VFHSRFLESGKPLLACRIAGEFPLCLGVRKDLTPEVGQRVRSDNLSIRAFVQESDGEILEEDELQRLGFHSKMFANLNTPRDWDKISTSRFPDT
jgi:molybdopterin-guanine dinucleotide biosynthesis protein A